ncbi:type II toxin-antitoxin system RelE/ParE family toxin [Anaerosalibacter massiliensis]|uniref:Type II toxin-antitoxin system RelE/ParE family toxin n=1 Tax=Anaerosalibacter massiliensis TaxID=1347392 RepID=A0A9X2MJ09_9FIRM|nr:type II toxin-antitoxin system RelE/ParE family toxin [Anaerosalibacter massiliensis]MCR2044037.1 type II toxin-antitoxin system RelE/ParE family toxin [Anaerosalibacter massiliensis]
MVKWSKTSTDDLKAIYDYIAKDLVVYDRRFVEEIINKSDYLKEYPNIGRAVLELSNPRIR